MTDIPVGYKQIEVGIIPNDWGVKKLGEISTIQAGGTPNRSKKEYYEGGNIPRLKSGELNDSLSINKNEEFITELGMENSSAKLFKKGTLLMAMYGATAGKLGILNIDATTNQAVCSIQNTKGLFDNLYVFYYLFFMRDKIILDSFGGAQPNISKEYIKNIEIPLPPLETQKAIVAKLDQIFAELDQTKSEIQKNLDNADELWKSSLNQTFQGDWEVKKLGEVIYVLTDYTANGSFASLAEHVKYKDEEDFAVLVRLKDLRKNLENSDKIYVPESSYNFLKKSYLEGGEYLIANVGANIGDCYEMPFINRPATLGPNMYLVKFNDKILQRYVIFMTESIIKPQIISNSVSSAQPKINKDQFRNIMIPVPPLSEQEKIVEHLDKISQEVKQLKSEYQSQLDDLEELKKSVLDKAFRGELGE